MKIKIIFLFITIYLLKSVINIIYDINRITEFNGWIECTCNLSISYYILLWKNKCAALSLCFLASLPLSRRNHQTCSIILINVLFFFIEFISVIYLDQPWTVWNDHNVVPCMEVFIYRQSLVAGSPFPWPYLISYSTLMELKNVTELYFLVVTNVCQF